MDKLVHVNPNVGGDTLTCYNRPDRQRNLGRIYRNEIYRAIAEYQDMYRIEELPDQARFGFVSDTGEVWADKKYLKDGAPDWEPIWKPEPNPQITLLDVIYVACKAVVELFEGGMK
jgi:hypothetical protein